MMRWWTTKNSAKRHGTLDPAMLAVRTAAIDAQRSRMPQMAAALSFRTLFGLLPVVFVALLMVRQFTPPDMQTDIINRSLEFAGLNNITISHPPPSDDFVGPPRPDSSVAEVIQRLIGKADTTISVRAMGIAGVITLLYAAIAMLVEIELAFNQIYKVPKGRDWLHRVANYWTLLTLGTAGLISTFYLGVYVTKLAQKFLSEHVGGVGDVTQDSEQAIAVLVSYVLTVCVSTILLTLAYKAVPNTRVKTMPALAGAFVAALAFEAGKWGFGQYVHYSTNYAKLYGRIAVIPLFMLWVYVTWMIVLFGLQIAYQLQYGLKKRRAMPILNVGPALVEPGAALTVASAVARRFQSGSPATARDIAKGTGLGDGVVELVLQALCEHGLVYRLDPDDGADESTVAYPLAKPATQIPAREVLNIGFELSAAETGKVSPPDPTLASLRQAQVQAMGDRSLAQVAGLEGMPARAVSAEVRTGPIGQSEVAGARIVENRPTQEPAQ